MAELIVAWRSRTDWPKWQDIEPTDQPYDDYLERLGRFIDRMWDDGHYPKMITVRPGPPFLDWLRASEKSIGQKTLDEYAALLHEKHN